MMGRTTKGITMAIMAARRKLVAASNRLDPSSISMLLRATEAVEPSTVWISSVSVVSRESSSPVRSVEHTSELQSRGHLICRLLLEKKNDKDRHTAKNT